MVRRSKFLPEPLGLSDNQVKRYARDIRQAKDFAVKAGEIRFEPAASTLWASQYLFLVQGRPGLAGALTARGAPIVRRWSLIYALLDRSPHIASEHLIAALALWHYAVQSARLVFGDLTGDAIADRILAVLKRGPLSQTDIYELFGRNVSAPRTGQALETLVKEGRIVGTRIEPEGGRGRPKTIWNITPTGGDQ